MNGFIEKDFKDSNIGHPTLNHSNQLWKGRNQFGLLRTEVISFKQETISSGTPCSKHQGFFFFGWVCMVHRSCWIWVHRPGAADEQFWGWALQTALGDGGTGTQPTRRGKKGTLTVVGEKMKHSSVHFSKLLYKWYIGLYQVEKSDFDCFVWFQLLLKILGMFTL